MHTDSNEIKAAINTLIVARVKARYEPRGAIKANAEAQASFLDELRQAVFDEVPKRLPLEDISRILDQAWKTIFRTHRFATWPNPPEILEAIREAAGDVVTEKPHRPPAEPIARREPFDWQRTVKRCAWMWEWMEAAGTDTKPQAVKVKNGRITHYRMTVNGPWLPAKNAAGIAA